MGHILKVIKFYTFNNIPIIYPFSLYIYSINVYPIVLRKILDESIENPISSISAGICKLQQQWIC